jgi:hypothetical protein
MPTKLFDLPLKVLRVMLHNVEQSVGPDSGTARVIRREVERKSRIQTQRVLRLLEKLREQCDE